MSQNRNLVSRSLVSRTWLRLLAIPVIALAIANPAPASAQYQPTPAKTQPALTATGIPASAFAPAFRGQRRMAWCWAAAIEMILDFHGADVNQDAIVRQIYGTGWDGVPPDQPGSLQQVAALLNQWGISNNGQRFAVRANGKWGAPTARELLTELAQGRPVMLLYKPNPQAQIGHYVVVTRAIIRQTRMGPYVERLVIWDPMPYHLVGMPVPNGYVSTMPIAGRYEVNADALGRATVFSFAVDVRTR
ncbi:MAG: C39 family peptidase [Planctomycetota bacterium]